MTHPTSLSSLQKTARDHRNIKIFDGSATFMGMGGVVLGRTFLLV